MYSDFYCAFPTLLFPIRNIYSSKFHLIKIISFGKTKFFRKQIQYSKIYSEVMAIIRFAGQALFPGKETTVLCQCFPFSLLQPQGIGDVEKRQTIVRDESARIGASIDNSPKKIFRNSRLQTGLKYSTVHLICHLFTENWPYIFFQKVS